MSTGISVAMAACNGEKYIAAQIESLLNQTLPPDEIVICDDCSTDNTAGIAASFEKGGIVKFYPNTERLGIIGNFKKAVSLCRPGNYIALCDQDDYWLGEKLQENVSTMSLIEGKEKAAIVFSDLTVADEHLTPVEASFWEVLNVRPEKERLHSLLFGNIVTGCTVLMNDKMKGLFLKMPNDNVTMHDAWLGLIAFTFGSYGYSNKALVLYRQHGANVTFTTNQKSSFVSKINRTLTQLTNNTDYLVVETSMAQKFLECYNAQLTPDQVTTLKAFISLRGAGFVRKKISSIFSRLYRLTPFS